MKSPLIVLCPPRSFSSVVCAMIGRHPGLYAFPELNLFVADTVENLLALSADYFSGIIRTVAELFFSGQKPACIAEARNWLSERAKCSTRAIMDEILARIDPLMGVEKSTRTGLSHISMERAFLYYPQARFLHLTRHPASAIESMHRLQAGLADAASNTGWRDAGLREYCANIWLHAHTSILQFTRGLPSAQHLRVKAEDIVRRPAKELPRVMTWLEMPCGPNDIDRMKQPEKWPFARPAASLAPDCDSSFFADPRLRSIPDCEPLESIRDWGINQRLTASIIETAAMLGYG